MLRGQMVLDPLVFRLSLQIRLVDFFLVANAIPPEQMNPFRKITSYLQHP
jgi:hypothetical protein